VGVERGALGLDADLTYFDTRVEDRITSVRASFPAGRGRSPPPATRWAR
jgi:hypothetical protein